MTNISNEDFFNLGAMILEAESDHFAAEYERLTLASGAYGALKTRAAYRLASALLADRATQYRAGKVSYLTDSEASND